MKKTLFVGMALRPIAKNSAIYRGARNFHHAELLDNCVIERLFMPAVRFAQENTHELGAPGLSPVWLPRLDAALTLHRHFDNGCVLNLDHPVGYHVVERREKLFHLLGRLDEFDTDREVLRQDLDFGSMKHAVTAKSGERSGGRGTGDTLMHQEGQDRLVQRTEVALGILVDVD